MYKVLYSYMYNKHGLTIILYLDTSPGHYRGKLNLYKTKGNAILHDPNVTKDDNGCFSCERTVEVVLKRTYSSDRPMSKKMEAEESAAKNAVLFIGRDIL